MKHGYLLLCLIPSLALADIYKAVDADGHVTYSSAPIKGGKKIIQTTLSIAAPAGHARSATSLQDFPRVNEETQKGRDDKRRKILEDELKAEEGLLGVVRQSMQANTANRRVAKDDENNKALTKQLDLHQRNIDALKTELFKLR